MDEREFVVEEELNLRLDLFLEKKLEISRSQVKKYIRQGLVLVNNQEKKAGYVPKLRDKIKVFIKNPSPIYAKDMSLDIVFEDEHFAVVNKRAHLVVHPGAGTEDDTLVHGLLYAFDDLAKGSSPERPGIVHRLDKDTSGLLIIAKTNEAYDGFVAMFKKRNIEKKYYAIVEGLVTRPGIINKPIGRSHKNRLKMAVEVFPSKEAITEYNPLYNFSHYSLLDISIMTGRTHQIRVHMASISHSVVGDCLYGKENPKAKRQLLHSYYLSFIHPISGEKMEIRIPMPDDFLVFIKTNGGDYATHLR